MPVDAKICINNVLLTISLYSYYSNNSSSYKNTTTNIISNNNIDNNPFYGIQPTSC